MIEHERRGGAGRRWLVAALAAVLVLAVGGGAWAFSRISGAGTQPEEVLPANAVAYFRVDLDPSVQQKAAIFNVVRKFPDARKRVGEGDDLRKALFEAIKKDDPKLRDVDYAKDVEPWLGDRAGVAVLPGADGKETETVAAVQIKDEDKARVGIKKLSGGDDKSGYAFVDDYMLMADSQSRADALASSVKDNPLSSNETFKGDVGEVDEGVMSFWADLPKLSRLSGDRTAQLPTMSAQGRLVGGLSFTSDSVQLVAKTRGAKLPSLQGTGIKLGELPSTTVAALSVSGAGPALEKNWPDLRRTLEASGRAAQLDSFVQAAQSQFGIRIPADLNTLLGKEFTVAMDERGMERLTAQGSAGQDGSQQLPLVGFRSTTDVAKARQLLPKIDQLLGATGAGVQLEKATGSDQVALATSQAYADELVKGGDLGRDDTFTKAVEGADKAQFGAFVDLNKLEKLYLPSMPAKDQANLKVLKAVGMSGSTAADGGTFTLRVLVD
ncbi:DUF3352 domain-containing protein [Actinopolymorpha singaporensis]